MNLGIKKIFKLSYIARIEVILLLKHRYSNYVELTNNLLKHEFFSQLNN